MEASIVKAARGQRQQFLHSCGPKSGFRVSASGQPGATCKPSVRCRALSWQLGGPEVQKVLRCLGLDAARTQ